jgi:peptide/nickel transport system substrate-binding protein
MATRVLMAKSVIRVAAALVVIISAMAFVSLAQAKPPAAPVTGGTLKIVAAFGPDHIDTVPAYFTADFILERAYARQLVSYRVIPDPTVNSTGWRIDTSPVPDAATKLPTVANGGITGGRKIYTFHIKTGVKWNTSPARQVTSGDFIREFKTFCNPAPGAFVGNLGYYTSTIVGMQSYCDAEIGFFRNHQVTAANIAKFANTHSIAGITAVNPTTIRFHLIRPASDFLNLLALPFASARPVEYNSYLPDGLQLDKHTISDGPYQITSYRPGQSIVLAKNPAWRQSADPIRHQYVSKITVTIGVSSAKTQVKDIQAGKFDLMLDTAVPTAQLPSLRKDPSFRIWPGDSLDPFLTLNMRSPNARHAIANLDVRKAIELGVNKAFVQKILGGPTVAKILNSAQPPGNLGFVSANPYPRSVAKCHAELVRGGHGKGVTLKFAFINDVQQTQIFAEIQASLKPCGINLLPDPLPANQFFTDLLSVSEHKKPGTFDLAMIGWVPDWSGNDGRSIIDTLFRTNCVNGTNNWGCYSNRKVDRLMTEAESASSPTRAAQLWTQAAKQIMADAAFVPLIDDQSPILASSRLREGGLSGGVVFAPVIGGPDLTNIWLKNG